MIEFANGSALWGLWALLVPTIVLLLSKKRQEIIEFGSLDFLEASESKTARNVYPTQWLLYFLRLLILGLLVLLLAKPMIKSPASTKRVIIEKEVFLDPDFAPILAQFTSDPEVIDMKYYDLLIHELNRNGDSALVYTRSFEKKFRGNTMDLNSSVEWNIVPSRNETVRSDTVRIDEESNLATIVSDEEGTRWTSSAFQGKVENRKIGISITSSTSRKEEENKLASILKSLSKNLPLEFDFEALAFDWQIEIDTLVEYAEGNLLSWSVFNGELSVEKLVDNHHEISGEISVNNLLNSTFPLELAALFLEASLNLDSQDQRVRGEMEYSKEAVKAARAEVKSPMNKLFLLIPMMILLLIERYLSSKRIEV